jgi:hypothetical protein
MERRRGDDVCGDIGGGVLTRCGDNTLAGVMSGNVGGVVM